MLLRTRLLAAAASSALLASGVFAAQPVAATTAVQQATAISETNSIPAQVDNGSLDRIVVLSEDDLEVTDVNVTIEAARSNSGCPAEAGFNLPSETFYRLSSPTGTSITLARSSSDSGGSSFSAFYTGGSFYDDPSVKTITFDDEATSRLDNTQWGSGNYKPADALAAFDGEDTAGQWTLTVGDSSNGQSLCHQSFTLNLTAEEPADACDAATAEFERVKAKMRAAKERVARARESGNRDRIDRAIAHKREVRQERIAAKAAFREACGPR